ncbi:MAG: ATP-dependent RNA helicase [Candidatus Saccharicenans subterraneus]|uniref:ATP-dependent RNA helicase n=1 Tax=Candidatus Saccharicenans subterraneus TaxID=2508984 RepID=A0A3E2BNB4_9BACT|nr:MAG: ATP-dependent RNA helicase [Candidatus Saccharicenans subterraneum]
MDKEDRLHRAISALRDMAAPYGSITTIKYLPPRPGSFNDYPPDVHPRLVEALKKKGFSSLYSHQSQAWQKIREGKNVVVVTPTASGKTLCYNLPVLDCILRDPSSRAIYLFPTKALSQDQRAELDETIELLGEEIKIFTYDGDTPQDARRAIRSQGHIIITNPDMLHSGILPHHTKWIKLFENLKFIIIDELHNYRGVFGSHVANVIRRLKRIASFYGAKPQFILSTATIANPRDMAQKMIEEPVELIDQNGAPAGEKYFVFYTPPVVNPHLGIRRSYINEARRIATVFLKERLQTIVFAQSRLLTEVLVTYLKDDMEKGLKDEGLIRGYRGGYLPARRREIERGLREGKILGVVSTNALELGIDIGTLDVAVLAGYPGTIASTWQRAGRAGRKTGKSAAVLVASSAPLDQFIINHPDYFFSSPPEMALINPDNLSILVNHIQCAAFELPFEDGEKFGTVEISEILKLLEEEEMLHHTQNKWFWTSEAYPADAISLRSISSDNFVVVDTTDKPRVIAEVDFSSALTTLHPKAIYICEGEQYFVEEFDYEQRKAYVKKTDVDYFTDAIDYTNVKILDVFDRKDIPQGWVSHGEVHVATQVVGFKKIKFHTMENVGAGELQLPQNEMSTTSFWLTVPAEIYQTLPFTPEQRTNGLFGLSYLLHHVAPLFLMCDLHDLGVAIGDNSSGQSLPPRDLPRHRLPQDEKNRVFLSPDFSPNLFLYDNFPGGIGLSPALFELKASLLQACLGTIEACPCEEGCPSCVGPVRESGEKAKQVARAILQKLLLAGA